MKLWQGILRTINKLKFGFLENKIDRDFEKCYFRGH
jgi:hypothetical protein